MSTLMSSPDRLWNRTFTGHCIGSITGAFNDNFFRLAFTVALESAFQGQAPWLKPLLGMFFILPFLLLAPTAGSLGDRWAGDRLIRLVRGVELPLVVLGGVGLMLGSIPIMLVALAGLGLQSALFAPVKYASLPDQVPAPKLAAANGAMQAATSLAILLGTAALVLLDDDLRAGTWLASWHDGALALAIGLALAVLGFGAAKAMAPLPAHDPQRSIDGPWAIRRMFGALSSKPGLWAPTLGLSAFWALGAMAQLVLVGIGISTFHLDQAAIGLLALSPGIGIIIGSVLAPALLQRAQPAGLPVIGALLATTAVTIGGWLAVSVAPDNSQWFPTVARWYALCLVLTGVGAGFWVVSLNTLLQERADAANRGGVYAAEGVMTNLGILIGFMLVMVLNLAGLDDGQTSLLLGGGAVAVALAVARHYPMHLAHWCFAIIARQVWRVESRGFEHLPNNGGCLIVCNHVSLADGPVLAASLPRPARYLVWGPWMRKPVVGFWLRAAGCLPVDGKGARALVASFDAAVAAAKAGEVVVIFPEGKLSRSGHLDVFKKGCEKIARRAGVPIIPAHLDGLHGSWLSRAAHRAWPRLRRPVQLRLGAALPADTSATDMRQAVNDLGADQAHERMETEQRTLAQQVLGQAHRSPFSTAVTDLQGSISRIELAGAALAMIPHFKLDADEKHVGVLLPPGVAGSLVNLALALDGRTSVNLNHTVGSQGLTRMAEIAGLRTIITADAYLKRISVDDLPGRVLRLESLKAGISFWSVLRAMAAVLLLPHRWLCRGEAADVATVIFSSGSTGDPKGVQLTHRGILANIDGVRRHLSLQQGHDRLLNPLPLFHSFGCSTGTWLPLCLGLPIIAHGDPNDGRTITRLAREHRPTFMVGTPTFVRSWMRRAEDDDFGSLTFAMVGAEKCPRDLAESFKQRFGADLLEGYGATELAPAIATGAPNLPIDGGVEINNAPGSVGRVLPGIAVSIHDVDSGEKLPAGADGMIIIRSPAVMQGYLGRDDLTEKVLDAHGYHTGDIGHLDEHGFLHITGRLARFAKIGGEMVPLDRIENDLRKALCEGHGDDWGDLAVAAVPDASRGERLLVLYTALPIEAAELIDLLADHPPIFRPRARDLHQVASLPVLGTGKRDLAALKAMAADFA